MSQLRSPKEPVGMLMLIVARGCVEQFSSRFTHFAASAVPKAVVWAAKSHSIRASCLIRRFHAQTTAPSALAARLFPYSPPNPTFALLAGYRGLPVTPPAEQAPRRADLECRCIGSHAASPAPRSAGETPSDRSLRGERRRSDGKATTLCSGAPPRTSAPGLGRTLGHIRTARECRMASTCKARRARGF